MSDINQSNLSKPYFFSSPSEAVEIITSLLKKEDFKNLSYFYDLSGSEIKKAQLESGEFFIRRDPPETGHPAGFWRNKHPFAPGFSFNSARETSKENIYVIEVSITIDQGLDSPPQTGLSHFYMKKYVDGWKLLPDIVDGSDLHVELPQLI